MNHLTYQNQINQNLYRISNQKNKIIKQITNNNNAKIL